MNLFIHFFVLGLLKILGVTLSQAVSSCLLRLMYLCQLIYSGHCRIPSLTTTHNTTLPLAQPSPRIGSCSSTFWWDRFSRSLHAGSCLLMHLLPLYWQIGIVFHGILFLPSCPLSGSRIVSTVSLARLCEDLFITVFFSCIIQEHNLD